MHNSAAGLVAGHEIRVRGRARGGAVHARPAPIRFHARRERRGTARARSVRRDYVRRSGGHGRCLDRMFGALVFDQDGLQRDRRPGRPDRGQLGRGCGEWDCCTARPGAICDRRRLSLGVFRASATAHAMGERAAESGGFPAWRGCVVATSVAWRAGSRGSPRRRVR